ncbi:succinate dehydrogenase, subunit D (sdhD) [Archaeoglobus fulgidus DSM 4304]|uniref:Succinate dehydrogenase hydrophobic membrane anchor subunit n=3 Tax=Archaeoglobus fulgidus TaxID=2234 RepID=DHSD_ARCFU|nr:RecName: Full=Succinate dehydrogenase hydrophobic membrane anchor subunit [Archaeoglobus fulgidus DSM 4304]AAB90554.1 succinate dehydrogenase, subunit D (sdhD) [Archaeoglobus fulgidus DSM 4304]
MVEMESAKSVLEPLAWLMQMITGLLMILLVTAHFYVTHMTTHDALRYAEVVERVAQPEFKALYALLLLAVSFHAFNGLRAILLDTNAGMRKKGAVSALTTLAFLLAFFYGLYLLFSI